MKQYRLRIQPIDSEPFDIDVRIYKTPQALQRAARRYDRSESWSGTLGVCHCFEVYSSNTDFMERDPLVCLIRLQEQNLGVDLISHEAAHAAVYIHDLRGLRPPTNGDDEEFAWVLGEITGQIVDCIYGES